MRAFESKQAIAHDQKEKQNACGDQVGAQIHVDGFVKWQWFDGGAHSQDPKNIE